MMPYWGSTSSERFAELEFRAVLKEENRKNDGDLMDQERRRSRQQVRRESRCSPGGVLRV